jgi:hypothetical protein
MERGAGGDNFEFRIANCEFEKAQGKLETGDKGRGQQALGSDN